MQVTYLSIHGKYGECSVACGTRNLSEYAERIYAYMEKTQRDSWRLHQETIVYISVNNNTNINFLKILFIYTIWNGLSQKTLTLLSL